MAQQISRSTDWLIRAAALVVILGALKLATPLVVTLLLAAFLAIVSAPLMFWLVRLGVHRNLAVAAAIASDVTFFGAMAFLAASGVDALVSALPRYEERAALLRSEASAWLLAEGLPDLSDLLPSFSQADTGRVVGTTLAEVARALSSLVLVLFIVAFLLVELLGIEEKLRVVFRHPEIGIEQFRRAAAHVQRYILVKTAANVLTGALVWLWLAAFRVDFAMLWGVCAFMLNYIPTIGSALVGIPVLVITLLQFGFGTTLVVGVGYVLINTAIAALVEPRVFGQALGLSPLVVFLSMVCWGWLWGPVGAVLSVPLTVIVKIALTYMEGYEWLSRLLGPVVGAQGVGTPSLPPHSFGSISGSVLGAGIALGGNTERASSAGLTPVILPAGGVSAHGTSPGSGMGPMVPAAPAYKSSVPPPPGPNDDELE